MYKSNVCVNGGDAFSEECEEIDTALVFLKVYTRGGAVHTRVHEIRKKKLF